MHIPFPAVPRNNPHPLSTHPPSSNNIEPTD
jgi:hypothetical protein